MVEETKKPIEDIEIDTDDVRQEDLTVEVKESANNVDKKEPAPNLNFGEVDLGGTEHESRTKDKKEEQPEIKVVDKIEEAKEDIQAEAKQIEQEAKQETSEEPEKDFDSLYTYIFYFLNFF